MEQGGCRDASKEDLVYNIEYQTARCNWVFEYMADETSVEEADARTKARREVR